MISFQVNDMTCGHCIHAIGQALKAEDAAAIVRFDLAADRVDIEPGEADAAALGKAIRDAGYTPVQIAGPGHTEALGASPARQGCCCR